MLISSRHNHRFSRIHVDFFSKLKYLSTVLPLNLCTNRRIFRKISVSLLRMFLAIRVSFYMMLALSFFISNALLGTNCAPKIYQRGQAAMFCSDLSDEFNKWKSTREAIGSILREPVSSSFSYNGTQISILEYSCRMEVYEGNTTGKALIMTTYATDTRDQRQFYSALRAKITELPEMPAEPDPQVEAEHIRKDQEDERVRIEQEAERVTTAKRLRKNQEAVAKLKAEKDCRKLCKQANLSRVELETAAGGLVFTEISEYFKRKDKNSKKAIFTEIIANLFLMSNYILSGLNQLEDGKQAYLDYSTVISILARATMTTILIKKLFEPRRNKEDKINKTIDMKKLGKIATHLGGILPFIRSCKFGPGGKHTYVLTLLIQLAYAMEIASKTNSSDSKLFKIIVPLVIGALPSMAAVRDQFTAQAIGNK